MNESSTLSVGRHVTCGRIFETFNDCLSISSCSRPHKSGRELALCTYCLSTTIMPDNDSQRRVELDDLDMLIVERPDTTNGKLVQRGPVMTSVLIHSSFRMDTAAHIVVSLLLLHPPDLDQR